MAKPSYAKIRQQVESRFQERQRLKMHVAVYLIVNVLLWGFWLLFPRFVEISPGELEFFTMPWPITVTVGWGLALLAHSLSYYLEYGAGARRRATSDDMEKPKNDQRFRLTEDGEIETVRSDDDSRYQQDTY
jgi:hypothetical protein